MSSDYFKGGVAVVTGAGSGCELLALCLFDDDQLRRVVFDEGVLAAMRPGAILAIHTTGAPALAARSAPAPPVALPCSTPHSAAVRTTYWPASLP
jgi:hypothetical protein